MASSLFLNVRILSPSDLIFEGEAQTCLMPTPQGPAKILPRHMSATGCLVAGKIDLIHEDESQTSYDVANNGFYRVFDNTVHIWVY